MKVVLFCGGLGLRLREYSETIPKPLVPIGEKPLIWHLMKYYTHYGHTEFILCLGHKAELIKRYFLEYNEAFSEDFVLTEGGRNLELLNADAPGWSITFVDTGLNTSVGERLRAVHKFVEEEEVFLANYVDGLTDLDLSQQINHFMDYNLTACCVSVRPTQTFHLIETDGAFVTSLRHVAHAEAWMNGGYYVFSKRIFEFLEPREDLVNEPFHRLIKARELIALRHDGFWACLDTFKERQQLEDLWSKGEAPWQVWRI